MLAWIILIKNADTNTSENSNDSPPEHPPGIDQVLSLQEVHNLSQRWGRHLVRSAARTCQSQLKGLTEKDIAATLRAHLVKTVGHPPTAVHNCTGTLLHTNLGRAPLSQDAANEVVKLATSPGNLELDLSTGRRGKRERYLAASLAELCGAESATFVNNNAASLLLVLNTLALQREVIVSRGELIEIGGSFRLPELMERSGCTLREVGTTNRTHLRDYEQAIGEHTAMLMKVHPSNFHIAGFTTEVSIGELKPLARSAQLPLVEDLGSGALRDVTQYGLPRERTVMDSLRQGADLVLFSGDKLLGGPQAGLIAGHRDLIEKLDRNPLKRALRLDKMALAALASAFRNYGQSDSGKDSDLTLPIEDMLQVTQSQLHATGTELMRVIQQSRSQAQPGRKTDFLAPTWQIELCESQCEVGSGALPGSAVTSMALRISAADSAGTRPPNAKPNDLLKALRALPVPVIARIQEQAVWLDLRSAWTALTTAKGRASFAANLLLLEQAMQRQGSEH